MTRVCPNCNSHNVEVREYYEDGVVTDQLFECQDCHETGDKYDFKLQEEESMDQQMAEAAMMMCGVDPKPARKKAEYKMVNPEIIPCTTLRPDRQEYAGKFVAEGFVINRDGVRQEFKTRTSMLVEVNIAEGYIETLNSIYRIV